MQQAVILDGSIDTVLTDWQWIILDGPVDTLWVENLNTVLDDSKVLCLANGERIALTPGMRLMFEVDDLSQASPATISRCAMVYMDPVDLGWRPYVKTWLQRLPKEMPESAREHLLGLFELSVDKGMTFIRQNRKYLMLDVPELSLVMCLCSLLQAFFQFLLLNGGFGSADVENRPGSAESESGHSRCSSSKAERRRKRAAKKQRAKDSHLLPGDKSKKRQSEKQFFLQRNPGSLPILLGKLFVFAFTWSYGGNLKRNDEPEDDGGFVRQGSEKMVDIASEFDNFIRELFEVEPPYGVRLPASSRSIYGYFVDMDTGNFLQWDILVPTTQSLIEKGAMITIGETMGLAGEQSQQGGKGSRDGDIVPTVDTVRYAFLAGLLLTNKNSVLLTGDSGVGKTVILESLLKQLGQEGGSTTKSGTVLGKVFHPADKNQALLSNISTLTKFGADDGEGEKDMSLLLAGPTRLRQTGVISATLQFSAQTTADRTKLAITQRLVKKGKDVLGAPKGKKVSLESVTGHRVSVNLCSFIDW
ncbi:hypothetical protein NP493_153g03009 [Ridgeia piscesae]|uniref:Dynein heavy chain AAA 5 extension domain-containing protein n=1 Tax=Ridgeia piscesae TaxID=27915 RepID=A0AAD9UFU7_RIDPI|nr:hypothetical protein NP493_153g03009 [Ridgeia piscesae]